MKRSLIEDGTYTSEYNNYIEFVSIYYDVFDDVELQCGQTSFTTSAFHCSEYDDWLCFVFPNVDILTGKISFDISVNRINSKPKKSSHHIAWRI